MRAWLRPLLAATLVGIMATPVAVASSAAAAPPAVLYERRVVTVVEGVDGPTHRALQAQCASDEVATGGGFDVRGTTDPSAYTVLGSEPTSNGWVAQIFLDGGFGHVDFAVHVVCLRKVVGDPLLIRRVATVVGTVTAGGIYSANPTCRPGEVATGGGYVVASINPVAYTVFSNGPLGNGWLVSTYSDQTVMVVSTVVCMTFPTDAASTLAHRIVGASGTALNGVNTVVRADCDRRTEVSLGGGFEVASINPNSYSVYRSAPAST
ncbi:MAG: hypothetical protein IRY85_08880, partial [Micromonosporaceae bacterium]|nr:hypothetical protein [Micromonosporaceae bacterium]